jgi:hypothetical protein
MTAGLAVDSIDKGREEIEFIHTNSIPPLIKALLQDLSTIRRVALTESPQILPLIAPALIEAEIHVRNLWQTQA